MSWFFTWSQSRSRQISKSVSTSDQPKPTFEPKPKLPKFRFVWAETETETESQSIPKPKPKPKCVNLPFVVWSALNIQAWVADKNAHVYSYGYESVFNYFLIKKCLQNWLSKRKILLSFEIIFWNVLKMFLMRIFW